MGMKYVEAVADVEIEPLLTPKVCHDEWIEQVNEEKAKNGLEVVMMYSNDSTYDTAGFAHTDPRIREHYVEQWFDEFLRICGGIGVGAQNALAEAGIRLYGGVNGSADAAAQALAEGMLAYDPNAKCDHHGHHHGEDHDCGHHGGHSCGHGNCGA